MTTKNPPSGLGPLGATAGGADPLDPRRCRAKSKRSGVQCQRFPGPGFLVCSIHGAKSPQAKAGAERRLAEQQAAEVLNAIWRTDVAPVTNPIDALQTLTGQLQHAVDVLGSRLSYETLDGAGATVWLRVLRELRQGLEAMERLGVEGRFVQLEQQRAQMVTAAFLAALEVLALVPSDRSRVTEVFLERLTTDVVAGEVEA